MIPRASLRRNLSALLVFAAIAAACSSSDDDKSGGPDNRGEGTSEVVHDGARTRVTSASGDLVLETTSTRADLVTAGDVLVTVSGPAASGDVEVRANGDDVTAAFAHDGDVVRGLVTGLRDGDNVIEATEGNDSVKFTVVNHPKNGPLFAGPHLEPWVCTTEGLGLGPALDEDCDAPEKTRWSYRSTDGSIKPLDPSKPLPDDVATTDVGGTAVPFVVRVEQGVIDRGVYWIWILDPEPGDASAWDPTGWNGRLVYRFGGGCGTSYSQGTSFTGDLDADMLSRGYAIATNTLDTFQTACNDVLSAEAAVMTREHFIERFGVPQFTIGDGGSGGAIQQLLIAHNYPGVLDALSPSVPFPDPVSVSGGVTDCGLLLHYYATDEGSALTEAQRRAINGHASTGTCAMWVDLFLSAIDPTTGCHGSLADQVYDPETNPDGVRCTLQDISVSVLGLDPDTGFARRPLDNVGVQYGLAALVDGTISIDEFLDLNEFIGGYDADGNMVAEREAASEETVEIAYRTGRIIGPGPLEDLPIILRNVYTDEVGDIHTRVWPFAIRERLRTNGADDPNLLLWTIPVAPGDLGSVLTGSLSDSGAIVLLDEWLTAGKRPADAQNRCVLPDETVLTGGWELYDEPGPCRDAYPVHSDPRFVAGQEAKGDVVKCALVPVDADSYGVAFSDAQATRLATIFPDGVCDWSDPGVGRVESAGIWQNFGT